MLRPPLARRGQKTGGVFRVHAIDSPRHLLLGQTQHNAPFADPPADAVVDRAVDRPLLGFAMLFTRVSCLDQRIVPDPYPPTSKGPVNSDYSIRGARPF